MASFITPIFFSLLAISPPPLLKKLIIGIIYGACSKSLSVLTRAPSVCLIENCRQFYQNYPNIVFSSYCIEVIGESRQLSCLKETMDNNKIWIVSRKRVPEVGCCNDFCQTLSLTEQKWSSSQNHLEIIKSVLVLRLTKLFWQEASPRTSCFFWNRTLGHSSDFVAYPGWFLSKFCTHLCTDICAGFCRPILIDLCGEKVLLYPKNTSSPLATRHTRIIPKAHFLWEAIICEVKPVWRITLSSWDLSKNDFPFVIVNSTGTSKWNTYFVYPLSTFLCIYIQRSIYFQRYCPQTHWMLMFKS